MSAALAERGEDFLAEFARRCASLPGALATREAAARRFAAAGLPTRRLEAWRYTDLRALAAVSFAPAAAGADATALISALPDFAAPLLVLVNGKIAPASSNFPEGDGLGSFARTPDFALRCAPLAALNTMLAEDGAVIRVADGVDAATLALAHLSLAEAGQPIAVHPRHLIRLGAGARLTLIEYATGQGCYWHNMVAEIALGAGAQLTHIRLQTEAAPAFHVATIFADIGPGARYDCFTLGLGARLARTEIHARLDGAGGIAHLNAAQLLRGAQHGDITTIVAHDAPGGASRQTVKSVLADRARGVFQGRIEVARAAQKTDGYQMSQALLLSPEAEIDCKPELEIFADDVKCSHGATIGALDPDQLFYLRARGIPEKLARTMLVRAFLDEAIEGIAHAGARAVLDRAIARWWEAEG